MLLRQAAACRLPLAVNAKLNLSNSLTICKRLNNGLECLSKEEKVMTCIAYFCNKSTLWEMDILKNFDKILCLYTFKKFIGMLYGPAALLALRAKISFAV